MAPEVRVEPLQTGEVQVKQKTAKMPKTLSVPEAGKVYYDLSKNASYEAARRGDIPTIRVGRLLRVPVIAMERMLAEAGQEGDRAA